MGRIIVPVPVVHIARGLRVKPIFPILILSLLLSSPLVAEPIQVGPVSIEPTPRWIAADGGVQGSSILPLSDYRVGRFKINELRRVDLNVFFFGPDTDPDFVFARWGQLMQQGVFPHTMGSSIRYIDLQGTHIDKFYRLGGHDKPDWRLLGAVMETPSGPVIFEIIGPIRIVNNRVRRDFLKMLESARL